MPDILFGDHQLLHEGGKQETLYARKADGDIQPAVQIFISPETGNKRVRLFSPTNGWDLEPSTGKIVVE